MLELGLSHYSMNHEKYHDKRIFGNKQVMAMKCPTHEDQEVSNWEMLSPNPVVSVVILTYNHSLFIRKAIDSILAQKTDFPFEICIGEDGSTDGTREICLDYAKRNPDRIRLFLRDRLNKKRKKYPTEYMHNVYESLQSCRGDYIATCEGDDYWTNACKLQLQIDAMQRHRCCNICFHPALEQYHDSPKKDQVICDYVDEERIFGMPEVILGSGAFMPTASIVFRRKIVELLPPWYYDMPVGDTFFQIYAALEGGALFVPHNMAVYRRFVAGSWTEKCKAADTWRSLITSYTTSLKLFRHSYPEHSQVVEYRIALLQKQLQLREAK